MNYLSNLLLIFSYFISRVVQWLKDYKKITVKPHGRFRIVQQMSAILCGAYFFRYFCAVRCVPNFTKIYQTVLEIF